MRLDEQLLIGTQMFSQTFRKPLGSRSMVDHIKEQVLGTCAEVCLPILQPFGSCIHPSAKLHTSETLDQSELNINLLVFPSLWLVLEKVPWCSLI